MDIPSLDIDKKLGEPTGFGKVERRVIANLLNCIQQDGFEIFGIDDGEEFTKANTIKAAMELIFNLDECNIIVKKGSSKHSVFIVLGNREVCDIIADWTYSIPDDGFDNLMQQFKPEDYE